MAKPLVLYSANAELAYRIAERYYGGNHFVWCTPCFARRDGCDVPPSSEPMKIATRLHEDIVAGDRHSPKIEMLRVGIKRGAVAKNSAGVVTTEQLLEINSIVDTAELRQFIPLLFVIPYDGVADLLKPVPYEKRASYSSCEYIIESLPNDRFDVIRIIGI